jgi:hypothetical protein
VGWGSAVDRGKGYQSSGTDMEDHQRGGGEANVQGYRELCGIVGFVVA